MSAFDDPLSGALALVARGYRVFPVDHPALERCAGLHGLSPCDGKRGKHPATTFTTRSTDTVQGVHACWSGTTRNVGVLCGPELLVIDEDAPGELERYCSSIGVEVPATFTVGTGHGKHYYFKVPDGLAYGNREGVFASYSINVRSGNGYVVGPGSLHETGVVYTPEDDSAPAVLMPTWLVDGLRPRSTMPAETLDGYDGQVYSELSAEQKAWADSWVARVVPRELARLEACAAAKVEGWHDKDSRYRGPDWNTTLFEVSCNLAEIERSPWNGYTSGQADVCDRMPQDAGFGEAQVLHGWRRGVTHTAGKVRLVSVPDHSGLDFGDAPASLWEQRESLRLLHGWARARRASPWAVLGVAMVRAMSTVPAWVVLPPTLGGEASLNLFVALVGKSGQGKGMAVATARAALDVGEEPYTQDVGSGEGLIKQYAHRVKADGEWTTVRDRDSVIFNVPEVDNIASMNSRQGANIMPTIRKAWSGEQLSFGYRGEESATMLLEHSYRLGMYVGVQPRRAGGLLSESDGGTPQRIVWLPTTDPDIPDQRTSDPDRRIVLDASPWVRKGTELAWVTIAPVIADTVDQEYVKRARGDGDALDGHALLCREKVAYALALLDGRRFVVTEEDWDLAGLVMQKSSETRAEVQAELSKASEASETSRGRSEAARSVATADAVYDHDLKRVKDSLKKKMTAEWQTVPSLTRQLASRDPEEDRGHRGRSRAARGVSRRRAGGRQGEAQVMWTCGRVHMGPHLRKRAHP